MRTLTSVFSILALSLSLGCSGGGDDDDDGGNNVDASTSAIDAGSTGPDAQAGTADGLACTATQENPTGGCPTGYACLSTGAGVPGNCAELCNLTTSEPIQANGEICTNYEGPGASICLTTLSAGAGQPPSGAACGVICADPTGQLCPAGQCNDTCPNDWSCLQHPNPQAPAGLKLCQ